ncbi:MAG: lysine-2,3-aminomutase-like protein [Hyphomicrobium sp.]|nr:lysine-2,3-aminomutase-like protein [Hyphomicrobium sp.]
MSIRDRTLRSADDLVSAGFASPRSKAAIEDVAARYAIAITPAMSALIDASGTDDPIGRQFLPDVAELTSLASEHADPIGDGLKSPIPGLVHRYPDRVLLKIVGVCPVYCRFCFRREMIGPDAGRNLSEPEIEAALGYIRRSPQVWEVILTGGDPFVLSQRRIRTLMHALDAISHVKVVRWHTRVPVVDPERITDDFVEALRETRKTVIVGLHSNHPRELTPSARSALARIAGAGVPLVSQTVLLRGINDDPGTLESLMRGFVENRVLPYYIHHGDLANGTAHFRVPIARGIELVHELHRRLSGIARPDYVLDLPGAAGKISLLSRNVSHGPEGWEIRDPDGRTHLYRDVLA